jgi:uncharacterized protein YggE
VEENLMYRRLTGVAAFATLLILAAGTMPASPAAAATTPNASGAGTVDATGAGLVQGTPDVLDVTIGVSTTADSAQTALQRANAESGQVISGLKSAGVAAADIQTRDFAIYPSYDSTRKRFTYSVANTVDAKLRDLLKAGAVLDDVASGAGNDIRIQGVSFSFADNHALLDAARAEAVTQARHQAEQLARGAGVKLGRVKSITEDDGDVPTAYGTTKLAQSDAVASAVPIEPGSESLNVRVHVVYAIAS